MLSNDLSSACTGVSIYQASHVYTRALAALQAGSQLDKPAVVPISQYLAVCGEADGSRGARTDLVYQTQASRPLEQSTASCV